MSVDYSIVTETPANKASREQLSRLFHRYRTASFYCEGKDVLEVGCGAGLGLGYLAKKAQSVIGGDFSQPLLDCAHQHYKQQIPLIRLDAERLPFRDERFDVVVLFETIYYLISPRDFFDESRRVLRKNGVLLISTVNRDWVDFNPSPLAEKYLFASELVTNLRDSNFDVELFGAYPAFSASKRDRLVSAIKQIAVTLHLVPRTMKGKELLKKIFFGKLQPIPSEVEEGMAEYTQLEVVSCELGNPDYKILYAVGYAR